MRVTTPAPAFGPPCTWDRNPGKPPLSVDSLAAKPEHETDRSGAYGSKLRFFSDFDYTFESDPATDRGAKLRKWYD